MCLGEFGTVVAASGDHSALVRFDDGGVREVSTAVLIADHVTVAPGDRIIVSMGMAIRSVDPDEHHEHRTRT